MEGWFCSGRTCLRTCLLEKAGLWVYDTHDQSCVSTTCVHVPNANYFQLP